MALARISGLTLHGVVSALPRHREGEQQLADRFGADQARRLAAATGIRERPLAGPDTCTSDLMVPAAQRLLDGLGWARGSVDLLVLVSQTHDHPLPATACLVQQRLGLGRHCAAFDLGLGCSGYVYGLWTVAALLRSVVPPADRPARALLLAGDTTSRLLDPADRSVAPLFGDAASATALSLDPDGADAWFDLGSDGAGAPYLKMPGGGLRDPGGGSLFMDGTQVFAFTLREVPGAIARTLAAAGWSLADVDHVVLHQANEMMIRRLGQKIGVRPDQLVVDLAEHGNTSSASIPLALSGALAASLCGGTRRLLLSGFGVGWSWATVALPLDGPLAVCDVLTVEG